MMQTVPGHATAERRMINPEPVRLGEAEREPLTPAERIALTIALLNRGLDLMMGSRERPSRDAGRDIPGSSRP